MTQTAASLSQLWEAVQGVGRWLFASVVAAVFFGMAACIRGCVKAMEMFCHVCVCVHLQVCAWGGIKRPNKPAIFMCFILVKVVVWNPLTGMFVTLGSR